MKIGTKSNTIIEKCIYAFFLQKEPHFEKIFETTFFHFQKIIPALTPNRCRNVQLYCTCEPRNPEWETSVGDKWETSVNSAPRTQSGRQVWETRVGHKCGRQVGDKCKIMRPKTPRVGDKCGRQVEDKCKLMQPKAPRVGEKCGRQVWETSGRQV